MAYWNEPVDGESLPQLSAHKGNLTCIVQPPDDPTTTTCPITGDPNAVYQVSASDAAAYVAKMATICNDSQRKLSFISRAIPSCARAACRSQMVGLFDRDRIIPR